MSVSACCLKGFEWESTTPSWRTAKLAKNDIYIVGDNPDVAIIIIHDLLGRTFPNAGLLADHYAREANAIVYIPDFFGGEVLPLEPILKGEWEKLDAPGFVGRNSREIRAPEIFDCARALREKYKKVGVAGFCYGGWAAFRLGAKEHKPPLVDCIMVGHPSLLTKKDINEVAVPVQILAPEYDPVYTAELKRYTFDALSRLGVISIIPGWSMAVSLAVTATRPGSVKRWLEEKTLLSAGLHNGCISRDAYAWLSAPHCESDGVCRTILPFPPY